MIFIISNIVIYYFKVREGRKMTFGELHIKLNEKIDEFIKNGQNYEEKGNYVSKNDF